jgi:hypothetical protein
MTRFSAVLRLNFVIFMVFATLIGLQTPVRAAPKSYSVYYEVSIAFISIGTARFSETRRGSGYKLHLGADFLGVFRYFFAPRLTADVDGVESGGKLSGARYSLVVDHPEDPQRVDMTLSGGSITNAVLTPPLPERADRVPVLPEHKRGVTDPLTAFLIPFKGTPSVSEVCAQTLKVFDGAGRFDITLLPDQERTISIPGYAGPTVDCFVRYMPVSGHREKRANVTYMENNRDISVRLAQVPGQSYLVPVEIQIATLIGNLRIEAVKIVGFDKAPEATTADAN